MKKYILKHYKAVIFDMDGVITNTMPHHYRAWKEVMAARGIKISKHDVYSHEGQTGIRFAKEILTREKGVCTKKEVLDILNKKESLLKKIVEVQYIPGSRNFIKYLHRKNILLALVTGTARHELHEILPGYLYDLFDVVVTGTDVKKCKPNPEPYIAALKKLNLGHKDAVVIENAPYGIQSAKSAKIACFALTTSLPEEYLHEADMVFSSIKEMQNKINF